MKKLTLLVIAITSLCACAKQNSENAAGAIGNMRGNENIIEQRKFVSQEAQSTKSLPDDSLNLYSDYNWRTDLPKNHRMDPTVFAALHTALSKTGIRAAVTVKDGVIIDEYYAVGYNKNSVFPLHSCSKSFTSALIGIAIEKGAIGSVDDLLSDYLPQVLKQTDERKHKLTLRNLLTQTSGLEWYEWGGGYSNWEEFRSSPDWVEYILNRRLVHPVGAIFNYSTGNTHLLAAALEKAVGTDALTFGKENLFTPLGMESVSWGTGPEGVIDGGNGIMMSARDAARFGQLFLQNGEWHGRQLIPADWVKESTSVQNQGPGGTGRYGYQWWIQSYTTGGYGTYKTPYPSMTFDTYFAFGYAGQFIYVVPKLNLVAVFAGHNKSSYTPRPYFTDYVLNAYMGK